MEQTENTDSHYKPWDTDFAVQSRNKAYKTVQKFSKNSRSDQRGGGGRTPPPEYATDLEQRCSCVIVAATVWSAVVFIAPSGHTAS